MSRRSIMDGIRLPSHEEQISAVTILDGEGRVIRVVPGSEFRRGPIGRTQFATRGRGEPSVRSDGNQSISEIPDNL